METDGLDSAVGMLCGEGIPSLLTEEGLPCDSNDLITNSPRIPATTLDEIGREDNKNYQKTNVITEYLSKLEGALLKYCLLYTSPSPRDMWTSRMPSSA